MKIGSGNSLGNSTIFELGTDISSVTVYSSRIKCSGYGIKLLTYSPQLLPELEYNGGN